MSRRSTIAAVLGMTALCAAATSSQTAPGVTYERRLDTGGVGPRRLAVDLPLLSGAAPFRVVQHGERAVAEAGLADLRLFEPDGRPVPYLLVPPRTDPSWRTGRILPVIPTKSTSGFEADLGEAQSIDRVRMTGIPAPFLKRLTLEGSGDRSRWTLLQREATLFDLPDERIASLELSFPTGGYRYLRVTWNDANSGRVPAPAIVAARRAPGPSAPATPPTALTVDRRPSEPGSSRYRIRLPAPHLPIVAVDVHAAGYVHRNAKVWESRVDGTEAVPVQLGSGTIVRVLRAGSSAESMRIPVTPPAEAEIELTVEDGDNPPLDLQGISAVFAELPWIYFEASSSSSLIARYGDTAAAPPRYDLEAARQSIDLAHTAEARWADSSPTPAPAADDRPSAEVSAGAVLDGESPYARRIDVEGRTGLVALPLDAAALSHSRGPGARFADVRVLDQASRQVPYLVERRSEPLAVEVSAALLQGAQLPATLRTQGENHSVYRVTLPQAHLPPATLTLETTTRVFRRSLQLGIVRPADRNRRKASFDVIAAADWQHREGQLASAAVSLPVSLVETGELWLVVDEGDNAPLPISAARLFLPSFRLRFYAPAGSSLNLVYGRLDLQPPRYDLALLASRLMGAVATEVTAAPEAPRAEGGAFVSPRWFWLLLSGSVLVLLLIIARLARRATQERG